ncbi:hypothetical protein QTJ16_006083 [Diplocarpon rosae]|uniref:Peptidase S53 activation domain-containing protein n=1 Tax=Diplocarpon rosae TaxID=946125 RepID=A0AAD9SYA9_9HELO|nr:hypothetical protein QTJ16_006083 [Diplocarpon rosae]
MLFNSILPLAFALASLGVAAPTSGGDATRVAPAYPTASGSLPVESASRGIVTSKSSIFEQIPGPPEGWVRNINAELDKKTYKLKLRIQLADHSKNSIYDLLVKSMTPGDKLYGNHLTPDEIEDVLTMQDEFGTMLTAQDLSRNRVLEWLASKEGTLSGRATIVPGNAITFSGTVAEIENILETEYWEYIDTSTGETLVRTLQYSLPDNLKGHVTKVQPTVSFGVPPPPRIPNGANVRNRIDAHGGIPNGANARNRIGANARNRNGAHGRNDNIFILRTLLSIFLDV